MTLYVSVPCYGAVISTRTVASLMSTLPRALQMGLISDYEINFHGEALINRCRNVHANKAMKSGWDKILTVDSDIEFTFDHLQRLISSPHLFIGGSYPLKCYPMAVNFNPLPGRGMEFLSNGGRFDSEIFGKFKEKYVNPGGIVEVRDLPTGFLCVDMKVFKRLAETAEVYGVYNQELGETTGYFDFYPTRVVNRELLSEDYGLCHLAREAGFKIMFDTHVITNHFGNHLYKLT